MNNKMRMLLQLIDSRADVDYLVGQGLAYSQISLMIKEAAEQGWIDLNEDSVKITQSGKEVLNNASLGSQGRWISLDERYKVVQSKIDAVYLPTKKESYFL